jgi:hypothetical protein
MSDEPNDQERPCLHCMMVDLIDDFFAEYPATPGGSDKVDTGEAEAVWPETTARSHFGRH